MNPNRGFTLVELMVVIAIIAILVAVGYPSYLDYVRRAVRSDAQQFLMETALREDQYILDNPGAGYTGDFAALSLAVPTEVGSDYTLAIAVGAAPPTYLISATPKPGTRMEGTSTLTLDSRGNKSPAGEW